MIVAESSEVRNMENRAVEQGKTLSYLMEKAGTKAAETAAEMMYKYKLKNICILCGTGNNGGDGFVAARLLSVMSENVSVILADGDPKTDLAKMNFNLLPDKVKILAFYSQQIECVQVIEESDIIIDAIYGIGFHGMLNPQVSDIMQICSENKKAYKIALDLPSGIHCDSGEISGDCFNADLTLSFTCLKPLHVLYPSMDFCGEIRVADVGISKNIIDTCHYIMKTTDDFVAENHIKPKKMSAHKGTNGTLLSICGSYGMAGAAVLAGSAALRTGVGILKTALPESIYPIVAAKLTESVFVPLRQTEDGKISEYEIDKLIYDITDRCSAVLIGCGLGTGTGVTEFVSRVIETSLKPVIVDADGINAVAANIDVLRRANAPIIMTPHPGEMARLLGTDIITVQKNRYKLAKDFAQNYNVILALKGANTLVAFPDGKVYVNRTGNNGMAKGGSGDVLAGMTASFAAQGMSVEKSAVYAVYYHGLAGDACAEKYSRRTMKAGDLIDAIRDMDFDIER